MGNVKGILEALKTKGISINEASKSKIFEGKIKNYMVCDLTTPDHWEVNLQLRKPDWDKSILTYDIFRLHQVDSSDPKGYGYYILAKSKVDKFQIFLRSQGFNKDNPDNYREINIHQEMKSFLFASSEMTFIPDQKTGKKVVLRADDKTNFYVIEK